MWHLTPLTSTPEGRLVSTDPAVGLSEFAAQQVIEAWQLEASNASKKTHRAMIPYTTCY